MRVVREYLLGVWKGAICWSFSVSVKKDKMYPVRHNVIANVQLALMLSFNLLDNGRLTIHVFVSRANPNPEQNGEGQLASCRDPVVPLMYARFLTAEDTMSPSLSRFSVM